MSSSIYQWFTSHVLIYDVFFAISSVCAFLDFLHLYTKKRKIRISTIIVVEWSTLFLAVMLSVANPSTNPGIKHTCMVTDDHLLMTSPLSYNIVVWLWTKVCRIKWVDIWRKRITRAVKVHTVIKIKTWIFFPCFQVVWDVSNINVDWSTL